MSSLLTKDQVETQPPRRWITYRQINCHLCQTPSDYYVTVYFWFFSSTIFGLRRIPQCQTCEEIDREELDVWSIARSLNGTPSTPAVEIPTPEEQAANERAGLLPSTPEWARSFSQRYMRDDM